MTLEVRPVGSDEELAHVARIVSVASPDSPITVEDMRWADATYRGSRRFLAWQDRLPVGAGGAGRIYMYPPEFDGLWANLSVLPEHRRCGIGGALLAAVSAAAREAGKTTLLGQTTSERPEAIAFLENRGFREHDRMRVVRLQLAGSRVPEVEVPAGLEITSLAERPDLVAEVYQAAKVILPDVPGEGPQAPATMDEFRARDVDAPRIPPGAFKVAVDRMTGHVAGYANLGLVSGNPKVGWHYMTGVVPAWRGRGLAKALKVATIGWAVEHGLEMLEGSNDLDNLAMRAVNRRLGYQPGPDLIGFRGPLWSPS